MSTILKIFKTIIVNHSFNFKPKIIIINCNFNFLKKFKIVVTNYDFGNIVKCTSSNIVLQHKFKKKKIKDHFGT